MTLSVRKQATVTSTAQTTPASAIISAIAACVRNATASVSSDPAAAPRSATTHGATARGRPPADTTGTGAVERLLPVGDDSSPRWRGMTYRRRNGCVATAGGYKL